MITYWSKLINGKDKLCKSTLRLTGFNLQQEIKGTLVVLNYQKYYKF